MPTLAATASLPLHNLPEHLRNRVPVGANLHRHGWPWVYAALAPRIAAAQVCLDDFIEQSYRYNGKNSPVYKQPWVAIVHNPGKIFSPLAHDNRETAKDLDRNIKFRNSKKYLRGVICLSDDLASHVRKWLGRKVKILSIKHPMNDDGLRWRGVHIMQQRVRQVASLGFFLRDTRVLYKTPENVEVLFGRIAGHLDWQTRRDEALRRRDSAAELHDNVITIGNRLSDTEYDNIRANCIVATWLYGASANNVVCECIASCTPIIVNKLPSVVEYLGPKYSLYADSPRDITRLALDTSRVSDAAAQLAGMDRRWMDRDAFAETCVNFAKGCLA